MDPHLVLGVHPDATDDEVHAAYIKLAKLVHPDRFVEEPRALQEEAARRMIELNTAYEALLHRRALNATPRYDTGPRVCVECEWPAQARDFKCAACGSYWSATTCVRCGRAGYSIGGGGALWYCRDCARAAHPTVCPFCGAQASGESCGACGREVAERACGYCGTPSLQPGGDAFACAVCHQRNAAWLDRPAPGRR
jgi:hypothetical protein